MRSLTVRLLLLVVCLSLELLTPPGHLTAGEPAPKQIYRQTLRSVTLVAAGQPRGSAWVVDRANRLLVTNAHVVGNDDFLEVIFPGYRDGGVIAEKDDYLKRAVRVRARVVDVSSQDDLAILQADTLPADVVALKLAAGSPGPGERVHSIGNPASSGALWVYTSGTVRQVYQRKWFAGLDPRKLYRLNTRVIETQSPTNPGDSGGPLVNDRGELIGVTQGGTTSGQLVSWFVDVTPVRKFVAQTQRLLKPVTAADFNERGARLLARERYDLALRDLDEALRLDPKLAPAYGNRAAVFNARGEHDRAIAECDRALALDPALAAAYIERGGAHLGKGAYEAAIADYTRALQHTPDSANTYNFRGIAQFRRGRPDLAIQDYSEALRLDPDFSPAWANRGQAHLARKDFKAAVADCTRALAGGLRATVLNDRGDAFRTLGLLDEALKDYNTAVEAEPNSPTSWANAALIFQRKGDLDRAIKFCDRAIALDPRFARAYFQRGEALEAKGVSAAAHADYEQACKLDPSWQALAPPQDSRYLRVVNQTGQPLRLYLRYEAKGKDGVWRWHHTGQTVEPLVFTLAAGVSANLFDEDWRISARRVRIWAEGENGGTWLRDRDRDFWLAQTPYRARHIDTYVYTVNP
ncbi:MAG TPA: tetratricopeptide repeat-containing serine protease family protein [Gemmataceae bacterium]|nr:tetratricopeptide repeat-containing serine protease family protein [Gemmataceae bacterium]